MYEFRILELAAFTFPGVVGLAWSPWACLAILCVYWLGHTLGAPLVYKEWKRSLSTSNDEQEDEDGRDRARNGAARLGEPRDTRVVHVDVSKDRVDRAP